MKCDCDCYFEMGQIKELDDAVRFCMNELARIERLVKYRIPESIHGRKGNQSIICRGTDPYLSCKGRTASPDESQKYPFLSIFVNEKELWIQESIDKENPVWAKYNRCEPIDWNQFGDKWRNSLHGWYAEVKDKQ